MVCTGSSSSFGITRYSTKKTVRRHCHPRKMESSTSQMISPPPEDGAPADTGTTASTTETNNDKDAHQIVAVKELLKSHPLKKLKCITDKNNPKKSAWNKKAWRQCNGSEPGPSPTNASTMPLPQDPDLDLNQTCKIYLEALYVISLPVLMWSRTSSWDACASAHSKALSKQWNVM